MLPATSTNVPVEDLGDAEKGHVSQNALDSPLGSMLTLVKPEEQRSSIASSAPFTTTIVKTEGPSAGEKELSLLPHAKETASSAPKPIAKPRVKYSKRTLWTLWFNTYRRAGSFKFPHTGSNAHHRKFFVFTLTINLTGIVLAASGHWPYAVRYMSALILGNIHVSVLVRNELFGRFLYLVVNTLFAKVSRQPVSSSHSSSNCFIWIVDSSLV